MTKISLQNIFEVLLWLNNFFFFVASKLRGFCLWAAMGKITKILWFWKSKLKFQNSGNNFFYNQIYKVILKNHFDFQTHQIMVILPFTVHEKGGGGDHSTTAGGQLYERHGACYLNSTVKHQTKTSINYNQYLE